MSSLVGRRKRGKITQPSPQMAPLVMPRATPQQGQPYANPSPISPDDHIATYKRRRIGKKNTKPFTGY